MSENNPQSIVRNPKSIWAMRVALPGGLEVTFPQAVLSAGIVFYSLAMPGDFKYKLDGLGFGVCHQIHTHSFTIGGHQLPLCARCTGIYLGALSALFLMSRLRKRAVRLPAGGMLGILAVFFLAMVGDGVNSTLQTFGSGFWDSTNLIRLITGTLSGLAVAFMFYPVFNMSVWSREKVKRESVLEQPFELAGYLVAAGVMVALVLDGGSWLLYPISILSVGGMLALLTMANTMLALMVTRREGRASTSSEVLTYVLIGFAISLVMLTLLAWGRASLAPYMVDNTLGIPLVPGLP